MSTSASVASVPSAPRGFRRVWRVLRQLFHETAAAIFAILAVAWVNYGFRSWSRDGVFWLVGTSFGLAAMFAFFAITSFRRSRKL